VKDWRVTSRDVEDPDEARTMPAAFSALL